MILGDSRWLWVNPGDPRWPQGDPRGPQGDLVFPLDENSWIQLTLGDWLTSWSLVFFSHYLKVAKPLIRMANWHPLTLLNTLYKLIHIIQTENLKRHLQNHWCPSKSLCSLQIHCRNAQKLLSIYFNMLIKTFQDWPCCSNLRRPLTQSQSNSYTKILTLLTLVFF